MHSCVTAPQARQLLVTVPTIRGRKLDPRLSRSPDRFDFASTMPILCPDNTAQSGESFRLAIEILSCATVKIECSVPTISRKFSCKDAVHSWKIDTQIQRHKYRGQVNKIRALFKAIFDAFSLVLISRPKYCLFVSQQLSKTRRPPTRDLSIGIVRIKHHLNVVFGPKGFGAFFLTNDMHS